MFLIVITDFCCWIPLSLLALDFYIKSYLMDICEFAKYKRYIELWLPSFIMLVIPINSSINPFLYSFRFWTPLFKKLCNKSRLVVSNFQQSVKTSFQISESTSTRIETVSSSAKLQVLSIPIEELWMNCLSSNTNS